MKPHTCFKGKCTFKCVLKGNLNAYFERQLKIKRLMQKWNRLESWVNGRNGINKKKIDPSYI